MSTTLSDVEALTEKIIGCAIEVHRVLGPGLLESVYRECLIIELRREGLRVESERCLHFDYKGQRISGALKLDLLVNDCIVVELKAVESLHPVHSAQVIYLLEDQRVSGRTPHELQFDDSQGWPETPRSSRSTREQEGLKLQRERTMSSRRRRRPRSGRSKARNGRGETRAAEAFGLAFHPVRFVPCAALPRRRRLIVTDRRGLSQPSGLPISCEP